MPVISEMLRGLETGLQEEEESTKKHSEQPEITVIPHQAQAAPTKDYQKTTTTTKRITQIQNTNSDDDNAPQHIEEYDPLTSVPTVPDDDIVSLDGRKTSSNSSNNLMRRISFSFFAFGKRKTSHHSALGHYHQHNKGAAVAVK